MSTQRPIKLSDYSPYPFLIPSINIDFNLKKEIVVVNTLMVIEPISLFVPSLVLQGRDINLVSIAINGIQLESKEYDIFENYLIIHSPSKSKFELKIECIIDPYKNTSLEGLYSSSNMLVTQCEAEGFRRICYHPDRPDILSKYKVRIESDRFKFPVLLSNGNKKYAGILKDNADRHEVVWEDPFPKSSYLFALVAGKLEYVSDTYITSSGRLVEIKLYVESGDEKYTKHALESLKRAMKWDEDKYNLEYDLNEYNIVAVRHFNMGAMENKGLNIFNSKLVLADSMIATDDELERIESVIAHEYFHNWTGNRITCRDWFQLSLKEGLTVFRDQSFTADLHNLGLKRIEDVSFLRNFQFSEDSGPTSHAVKPKEYVAIDNFYTTTIYEKGAELIRMLELLLGSKRFFKGIKFYIDSFDGSAATTEDFVNSIIKGAFKENENCLFDVAKFQNWYYKAGTPKVFIKQTWNSTTSTLNVTFQQRLNNGFTDEKSEMIIPILYSCYSRENSKSIVKDRLFILDQEKKSLQINCLEANEKPPVLSLFRRFSSPVIWESYLTTDDYFFLILNDNDYFTIWDSCQSLMRKIITGRIHRQAENSLEERFFKVIQQSINKLATNDPFLLSTLLTIPGLIELERSFKKVNPNSIYQESLAFQVSLGLNIFDDLKILSENLFLTTNQIWPKGNGERKLLGIVWSYLVLTGDIEIKRNCVMAIDNPSMTISKAALNALKTINSNETEEASCLFYNLWKENPVVLDSWFSFEASRKNKQAIDVVERLLSHSKFDWKAPNAIRAVLGGFSQNIESFHSLDGQGYLFMAEKLIEVDKINPITASRMVKIFSRWKTYIDENREGMYKAILKLNNANISSNTREVVELILK